ncbi:TonB-dependent receptor domain-containing protein [Kerstersia similis]|uniref:TonB-dependent receptor n=1 Tax=Kerstersia similis TaxID=206505 RepID=UPI0039F06363
MPVRRFRCVPAPLAARLPVTRTVLCCALLGMMAPPLWPASTAHAATATAAMPADAARIDYAIPAGPLSQALILFGRTSGSLVTVDPALTAGEQSRGVRGNYRPAEALTLLLAGTRLEAVATPEGGWRLRARPENNSRGVAELSSVEVIGQAQDAKDMPYQSALSASVLTRDDIERFRGTSVGDIFQGVPGVLVGENRNSGGLDINIRGMQGQGRVPILVDGARQETTVNRGYSGVISRSYVDPDLIGGITIEKGPVMSAQGTGATGGLVTMRTLDAADIVKDGESFGIRVRGQAIGNNNGSAVEPGTPAGLFTGNFHGAKPVYRTDCVNPTICSGEYALPTEWGNPENFDRPGPLHPKSWAGSLALAQRLDHIDLIAAYSQRHQGNYFAGTHGPSAWMDLSDTKRRGTFYTEVYPKIQGATRFEAGERIPGTNYESKSGLLKAKVYLPADQDLELSWLRYSSVYSELMPGNLFRLENIIPITQPRNSDVVANTLTSRYRWVPADNNWFDLRANLWHTRTKATNNSPSTTEVDLYNNERETYKRTGLDLSNTSSFSWGWLGESQLRYGIATQWEDVHTTALTEDFRGLAGRNGDRREYSAFIAWQYKPVSSITLDAGLRYSRFKSNDDKPIQVYSPNNPYCVDADGDGRCDPIDNSNRSSGSTPIVSLTWEPLTGLQLYGRYAKAMRMPSLFESTSGFSFESVPDIPLKPERATNKEIGLNFLASGLLTSTDRLRLKTAYFRNYTKDYLTRTNKNVWEFGNDAGSMVMRNIEGARFHGMEISGDYDAGVIFTAFGATKYNKIEICHRGSYRVNICNDYGIAGSYLNNMVPPKWNASFTLGTRLFDQKLTLGARGTFMGQRTNAPEFNDDTAHGFLKIIPWHSYKVFDFFANYKVNETVSIDFNIDNFTDRFYLDALGLGLIPAPGRTARLGITLQM